ncbi:DUF3052 domain-containing protein [Pseudalkalibacillus decolorationis]|uniref:DUF3052 domain-containing protein n=1 Tax=Pseudalkalibacillus decolorationis TaxID=163879 RepID=UPI0021491337|nr:DUF3052 domain-containing protein [Pseudalkalibacillus decolorationis]
MHPLLKKMNFKNQHEVLVVNTPEEFEPLKKELAEEVTVLEEVDKETKINFVLIFAINKGDIERYVSEVVPLLAVEAIVWLAYPKKSSKRYKSDITRDIGWEPLGTVDFEPVRQVAIDEDWSALRFRHVDQIQSFTRNKKMTWSEKGKARQH